MVIWWDYSILYIIISGWWCNNNIEKYEFVNGKDYPIYEMEKICSKPPTRVYYGLIHHQKPLTNTDNTVAVY